jgi:ribosomal protein S12 methylthiotransferase accessory factor
MTLRKAFEGCVGEAIEYVSQLERDEDISSHEDYNRAVRTLDPLSQLELGHWVEQSERQEKPLDWIWSTRLSDDQPVLLPTDFCLRRRPEKRALHPPFLLGTGTAAGESLDAATLHAVLELIERDALGLWWKGGRRGFKVDHATAQFELTLGALRRGRSERKTWLLDITTDLLTPCIVAISCGPDGDRFAFGAAARLDVADAARTALLELCQLELALDIVDRKARERGADALNSADRQHLLRSAAIDAITCTLTQPSEERPVGGRGPNSLGEIIARASEIGVEFHRVDITRPQPGIAAVRVVAPTLQLEPSQLVSRRLAQTVAETGGGETYTRGAQLL